MNHAEELAQAKRHIKQFIGRIAKQEATLAELQRDGHDVVQAKALLAEFEESLRLAENHRQILLDEIAQESRDG